MRTSSGFRFIAFAPGVWVRVLRRRTDIPRKERGEREENMAMKESIRSTNECRVSIVEGPNDLGEAKTKECWQLMNKKARTAHYWTLVKKKEKW